MNASGGVPLKTSVERGSSTCLANVSQHASRSRWKCTQPFGVPVVPDVKAMIATSSAAVSTGSKAPRSGSSSMIRTSPTSTSPARSRVTSATPTSPLRGHLRDLPRAQERHRRDHDPAREQDPEPARDRLRRVRRVQEHARPGLDRQRRRDRRSALVQLGVAPAAGDRRPLVRQQLDRRVHPRRPVEQQQVGPRLARRQVIAGERVHQSRPASSSLAASPVGFVNRTSWLPGIWTSR